MLIKYLQTLVICGCSLAISTAQAAVSKKLLEEMTWVEAEHAIKKADVIIIPIGGASKEHGLHLPNNTDFIQANYLRDRLLEKMNVIAAPTINYSYYPAFIEYPGSISLDIKTSTAMFVEICRSLHRQGAQKFYFLNTGISTLKALAAAQEQLKREGITMAYSDFSQIDKNPKIKALIQQKRGTHADEGETSIMLYISPEKVDMKKARKDDELDRGGHGRLTRLPDSGQGVYSATGAWGDPTLGTREKGKIIVGATIDLLQQDILKLINSHGPYS